jgi:cellulose biosynthesis protein BcsE
LHTADRLLFFSGFCRARNMNATNSVVLNNMHKLLGIPGIPPSVNTMLNGSIYASIVDSVPAHFSLIIHALNVNLQSGSTCVLVTQMTPGVFLSRAKSMGSDFGEDILQSRLYLFTQEGDYTTNIFRYGIKRFLQEFDFFRVPKSSFFLFDEAGELFTMSDQHMAQTQAMEYRDWMKSNGNTGFFIFPFKGEKRSQSIFSCFNGVARINQSKFGLELLIDFWYSEEGAIAAKAFPVVLDTSGLIRVDTSLPEATLEAYQVEHGADDNKAVFYLGPDFKAFFSSVHHSGVWKQAQDFIDLVHLSKDAARATVIISIDSTADLKQIAKIVHYLRTNRGNRLRIVIKESGFSLRYLNELLLLRFGANLIIHQNTPKQQLPLLWEMLAGQTYSRKIEHDFEEAYSSTLSSDYKGYVDLVTFCSESLQMFERGDMLDIPLALIVASYYEQASVPDVLSQMHIVRNGDLLSSSATQCYIFMHACAEENVTGAFSRITCDKQYSLFSSVRIVTEKNLIREQLESMVKSGNISVATDYSEAIKMAVESVFESPAEISVPLIETLPDKVEPERSELAQLMSRLSSQLPT